MNADIQYSFTQTYILITHLQNPVLYVIAVLCHLTGVVELALSSLSDDIPYDSLEAAHRFLSKCVKG